MDLAETKKELSWECTALLKQAAAIQEEIGDLTKSGGLSVDFPEMSFPGRQSGDLPDTETAGISLQISQMQLSLQKKRYLCEREKLLSCIDDMNVLEPKLSGPETENLMNMLKISRLSLLQLLAHVESEIRLRRSLLENLQAGNDAASVLKAADQGERLDLFRKKLREEADSV